MSTPPIAAPLDPSAQPVQPGLSQAGRIINTFIAPRKTFEDLKRSSSWWLPFLLLCLTTTAFIYVVNKKVGADAVVNNMMAHASFMQRATSQMSPEQLQNMTNSQIRRQERSVYTAWLGVGIGGLVLAALLMPTFNFMFDAQVKFKNALAIVFYGWLPKIIFSFVALVVIAVGVEPDGFDLENPVATNPGVLLGSNTDHRYLYRLLSGIDLFSIWWVILVGLGFAVVARKKLSVNAAVATVAVWYLIFTLLRLAMVPFAG